jgi:hypothetical protein
LVFSWKLFYAYDNTQVCDAAQGGSCSLSYLFTNYSYYSPTNQEYIVWHAIDANSFGVYGPYRIELWINGQKASGSSFNLIVKTPGNFRIDGTPSASQVSLKWSISGSSDAGSGIEVFRDSEQIAFIAGTSTGYVDTAPLAGGEEHEYRVRDVEVNSAGTFRSEFTEPLLVTVDAPLELPGAPANLISQ